MESNGRTPYISRCWSCTSRVDSTVNPCCQRCHWLLCRYCGACWCNMPEDLKGAYRSRPKDLCQRCAGT